MSCKCQRCGDQYKVDVIVPDEIWEKIAPEGKSESGGMLCGKCIFILLELINEYKAFRLAPI